MTIKNIEDQKLQLDLERKDLELRQKELEYLAAVYEDDTISTFEDGKYLDYVRVTIMELLSMNVSLNKVNEVIRIVLERFAGKEVDRLPSKGLLSQFLIEARHLADMHIGDAILKGLDLESV